MGQHIPLAREQMAVDQPFLGGSGHVQIVGLLFFLGELLLGRCEGRGKLGERLLPIQVILVDKRSPRLAATMCPGPAQIGQWLVSLVTDKLADPFGLKISLAFRDSDVLESWTSRETGAYRVNAGVHHGTRRPYQQAGQQGCLTAGIWRSVGTGCGAEVC